MVVGQIATFRVGSGTSPYSLTLTTGNITRNTGGQAIVGDTAATGGSVMTLETNASGFTFDNNAGNNFLDIEAVVSGSGKTVTIANGTGTVRYTGSSNNTYSGTTIIQASANLHLNRAAGTTSINGPLTLIGGLTLGASNHFLPPVSMRPWAS